MAKDKKQRVQDRLRSELNNGKGIYSKKKLITVMLLCCIVMSLTLPYLVQIPLLIYFGICIKRSTLDNSAQTWLSGIDKHVLRIWTVASIVYLIIYAFDIIKYGNVTTELFNKLYPSANGISVFIPTCAKYTIEQYIGLDTFIDNMATDSLDTNKVWETLGKYDFVAFSPNYIGTIDNEILSMQFTSLVSPLAMLNRLIKINSLITTTCTAWLLSISRCYYWFKSRKHKA